MSQIDENIQLLENGTLLTQQETELFDIVKEICTKFDPPVVARAAGGWVRDKLLGSLNDDIDIAVENATGLAFAEQLKSYLSGDSEGNESGTKIVLIEANPEQSKHLQTARVCLFNHFWVDICGLRSETYATDSRIPNQIKQGTPLEDAQRRDFTINALFFNINASKLEDYTNGVEDLKAGILKTPLDPEVSFGDDPLRVLRAFRFSARFNFKLDDSLIPAARKISTEFRRKIARERIETELTKAFEASLDPPKLVEYFTESNLFGPVFDCDDNWHLDGNEAIQRVSIVMSRNHFTSKFSNAIKNHSKNQINDENLSFCFANDLKKKKLVLIMSAIYEPLLQIGIIKDSKRHNKKATAIEIAIGRELRLPIKFADESYLLLSGISQARQIMNEWKAENQIDDLSDVQEIPEVNLKRSTAGLWVKNLGPEWNYAKYLAMDDELFEFCFRILEPFVVENNLENAYDLKPLLNGKELADLHGITVGANLRPIINDLTKWQFDNPTATSDDYIEFIKSQK